MPPIIFTSNLLFPSVIKTSIYKLVNFCCFYFYVIIKTLKTIKSRYTDKIKSFHIHLCDWLRTKRVRTSLLVIMRLFARREIKCSVWEYKHDIQARVARITQTDFLFWPELEVYSFNRLLIYRYIIVFIFLRVLFDRITKK